MRPHGSSAREEEVASLVAQALSNRQIAERLVLSERTVETHVRSILAKLNFSTRTEIATWVLRITPSPPSTAPERCQLAVRLTTQINLLAALRLDCVAGVGEALGVGEG